MGLLEHGWIEGRNLEIDYRWGGGDSSRLRAYAVELTALNPDVIFAAPSAALAAVQRATRTIPVVFAQVSDPVGAGFVASLAHPGGNITGFALFEFAVGAKWLELLKQVAPSVSRVAVIYDPATPSAAGFLPLIEAAGRSFGVDVFVHSVRDTNEIERHQRSGGRAKWWPDCNSGPAHYRETRFDHFPCQQKPLTYDFCVSLLC
jgi:putative ABC transport system substrate-binding protein